MLCPKCGKENPEQMKFCSQCGTPINNDGKSYSSEKDRDDAFNNAYSSGFNPMFDFGNHVTMNDDVTRSKIYSYFYGANTVFQQFIMIVGVFFFMVSETFRIEFISYIVKFLGVIGVLGGFGWFIYKKIASNKSGESVYDSEIRNRITEAKRKGMEKLNIISEQIERVNPVVLNGIARFEYDEGSLMPLKGIAGMFQGVFRFILSFDKMILGLVISFVLSSLCKILGRENVVIAIIFFLLLICGIGFLGYLIYTKYEMNSYVKPKVIERLNKFSPKYMEKLGSDDRVRVSLPAITVYMFGDEQLYMYYQYLDIVTGKIFCEGIHEYFYEDIVGVTSSQETKKIFKRSGFMNLFLTSVDYLKESITVVSSGCMHKESYVVDIGNSLLDTQFVGMRNLIRQKKMEK